MSNFWFRARPRLIFASRVTVFLVLLAGGVFFLLNYFDPAPSQADIVQAFNGYTMPGFSRGPTPGIHDIHKESCAKVAAAAGYLCKLDYALKNYPSQEPLRVTRVHRLFKVQNGKWGEQIWTKDAEVGIAEAKKRIEGHQFWRLVLYAVASTIAAAVLCHALPDVPWSDPSLHERATPWITQHPLSNDNHGLTLINRGAIDAANTLTPAAAMGLFALALGVTGFVLGGLVVPESFINLRYVGWTERLCLLTAAVSWGAVGLRLPMFCVNLVVMGLSLALLYVVLAMPILWVVTGDGPGQQFSKNIAALDRLVSSAKPLQGKSRQRGFEGYQHLMNW